MSATADKPDGHLVARVDDEAFDLAHAESVRFVEADKNIDLSFLAAELRGHSSLDLVSHQFGHGPKVQTRIRPGDRGCS